ncbi:hypothetical protein BH09ACT12_BH09ACT12_17590 [soil metagenome]
MSIDPYVYHETHFDASEWSDTSARAALHLIAESVAQMVGFEVAAISAVQGDVFVSVAIEGDDSIRSTLGQMRTPLENILADLEVAEDWGRFKFVGHEHAAASDGFRWVPDTEPGDEPDSWHPLDSLLAPLYSDDGELRGLLSIDLPLTGRRPDPTQRNLLERYATQAERALLNAFEREELAQRLRLSEAARRVVRVAVSQPDVQTALDECRPALLEGFRADDLTIRTYPDEDQSEVVLTPPLSPPDRILEMLRDVAGRCWTIQRVGVLTDSWQDNALVDSDEFHQLGALVDGLGFASALIAPIGAGQRCLGHMIMFRKDEDVGWTADERASAMEVARDIGHAVLTARNLAREQRLVSELRKVDTYKTQLLSTVSHELKNPLGAIAGHLELVAGDPELSENTQFSVGAMERATVRISRVVDDLLTLAKVGNPETMEPASALDLQPALTAALESSQLVAESHAITMTLDAPAGPLMVAGDEEGLERVLTNLVGNAVKYSKRGGAVTLTVTSSGAEEIEVAVTDQGLGISEEDQARLFTEFFRSTNPVALAQPGTGLGLAISARIIRSHGGRITVESTLGQGSTFRVFLPVPAS